jgi:4-carboxymuconolactone decarboxylase
MRVEPLPPDRMPPELRALHDEMAAEIREHLTGFVSARADGALVGPFAPMLRFPRAGAPAWRLTRALIDEARLAPDLRDVAILATGAAFDSRYELYAHERVARGSAGLPEPAVATLAAGQRPPDLTAEQGAAYDLAATIARGSTLPEATWRRATSLFGEEGAAELVWLVALYGMISIVLNAFDVPVPGRDAEGEA